MNEVKRKLLRPGHRPKRYKRKIFGYDTETQNDNQDYVLSCLYFSDTQHTFFSTREEFYAEIIKRQYAGCIIGCHNLQFDFHATFPKEKHAEWNVRYSEGGSMLHASTYVVDGKFSLTPQLDKNKRYHKITFIDTCNFANMKLKHVAQIIGMRKFEWDFKQKLTKENYAQFAEYNKQDAKICKLFLEHLCTGFFELGANFKPTLAATAMSIYKNVFLKKFYSILPREQLEFCFKGYYGGRTETFARGTTGKRFYYDFNSLYPSVMANEIFPDPDSDVHLPMGDITFIMKFEGCSYVKLFCPDIQYPLLPTNEKNKVLFRCGTFEGVYNHNELRKALELGYKILEVQEQLYFTKTCRPFIEFVTFLYDLRMKYRKEGNEPMAYIIKIIMNSLYGKFGQRFGARKTYYHKSIITFEMMNDSESVEEKGEYVILTRESQPASFCMPIWASYITSYGRLKLYDSIIIHKPDMVDTDSIIIDHEIEASKELGKLKLEYEIPRCMFVRPKMYALDLEKYKTGDADHDEKIDEVKCKGLSTRMNYIYFYGLLENSTYNKKGIRIIKSAKYSHFVKFRESLRLDLKVNSVISVHKEFSLEDDKRFWPAPFEFSDYQQSEPLNIINGKVMNKKKLYVKSSQSL